MKNVLQNHILFLVIDVTTALYNSSRFRNSWHLMIRLEMNNYDTVSTEKQPKYQLYHQVNLINVNALQVKKCYLLIKVEFISNKSFGQLSDILLKNYLIFLWTFDSDISDIKVWFTDQNFKPLDVEDRINISVVIN